MTKNRLLTHDTVSNISLCFISCDNLKNTEKIFYIRICINSRNNNDNATFDNYAENNDNHMANIFDNLNKLNYMLASKNVVNLTR